MFDCIHAHMWYKNTWNISCSVIYNILVQIKKNTVKSTKYFLLSLKIKDIFNWVF